MSTSRFTSTRAADDAVADLAARQHGVMARPQLLDLGLTSRMLETRLRSGELVRLHRGVYRLGRLRGPLEPPRSREMAAVLACGRGAVVSHRSAAWIWELAPRPDARGGVDISVPHRRRPRGRTGIRVHRTRHPIVEATEVEGIPVTPPDRTLRDLSAVWGPGLLERAVARAEKAGLISPTEFTALGARQRGRCGAPVLRQVFHRDRAFTRSEAESRFLELLREGGLPRPETNIAVHGHEVDVIWPTRGLAVEVDGFEFHASRRSFESDRRRDAELAAAGIQVIRVTWRQISEEPTATVVRVAQALARAGGGGSRS